MSKLNHHKDLKFSNGRSIFQVKKDAKRLKKKLNITMTQALNQCAVLNGMDLPWDRAMSELSKLSVHQFNNKTLKDTWSQDHYSPRVDYITFRDSFYWNEIETETETEINKTTLLYLGFSKLPREVYETLISHPEYKKFLEGFMRYSNVRLEINDPHKDLKYRGEGWQFNVIYDEVFSREDDPARNLWIEFKEWLMQFNVPNRLQIIERTQSSSYLKTECNNCLDTPLIKYANQLKSDVDRALYYQMGHQEIRFRDLNWRYADFSKLDSYGDFSIGEHRMVALFEYELDGQFDTVSSDSEWLFKDYSNEIRLMQLYALAACNVVRFYRLTSNDIPFRLLSLEAR